MDWNNKQEVLEKVKIKGWELEFASDKLKSDKEIALIAVKQYGYAFEFISSKLKDNIKNLRFVKN